MKILIVGGGVAGPALAGFLKNSAEITLIDKAPQWGNIGYAIALWGNGQKILKQLGIDHKVLKMGYEIPWNVFEDKKGKILTFFTFNSFHVYGPTAVVTRTDLQQSLVKNIAGLANVQIKLGTTLSSIAQEKNKTFVTLSDGSAEYFDLVVGADGIHSQVRDMVFGTNFLKYYGWTVYAFWLPQKLPFPKGAVEFAAGGKICLIYPMEDKAVVMFIIATPPKQVVKKENSKELLHSLFHDFKDSAGHMIDAIEDPTHIFRDDLAHIDMQKWYKGNVVLMGDAKHATSPITGMGASMALEDAFVLAEELRKVDVENIDTALKNYQTRRDKRVHEFRTASRFVERWMLVESPLLAVFRDIIMRLLPANYFTKQIEKLLKEEI